MATLPPFKTLEEVTEAKFGQAGLDAIRKYPCLTGAKIRADFYMVEAKPTAENLANPKFHINLQRDDSRSTTYGAIDPCKEWNALGYGSGQEGGPPQGLIYKPGDVIAQKLPPTVVRAVGGSSLPLVLGFVVILGIVGYLAFGR